MSRVCILRSNIAFKCVLRGRLGSPVVSIIYTSASIDVINCCIRKLVRLDKLGLIVVSVIAQTEIGVEVLNMFLTVSE